MASGTYSKLEPMPFSRSDMTVTTVGTKLYIAGGCDGAQDCNAVEFCACTSITNNVATYMPLTDSYGTAAPMPRARYRHLACETGGTIYVFGGRDLTDAPILEVDALDTKTGAWTTLPASANYPSALGTDNSCSTVGGSIFVMGGYSPDYTALNATFAFTPAAGPASASWWVRKAGQLLQARGDFSSVEAGGKVYAYGGYVTGEFCTPIATTEVYNPAADTWGSAPSLPMGLAEKDDGLVLGGRIYSFGGETKSVPIGCTDEDIMPLRNVYSMDPAAPAAGWRVEPDLPIASMRFGGAAFDEAAYIFGGQGAIVDNETLPIAYRATRFFPGATPTTPTLTATPTPTATPTTPAPAPSASNTYPAGTLAGAIVGTCLLTVAAIALCAFLVIRKRRSARADKGLVLTSAEPLQSGGSIASASV